MTTVVTHRQLVARAAAAAALDERSVDIALRAITTVIGEECRDEGKDVRVHGFGRFRALDTRARKARNPRTGEMVDVPARRRIAFKASSGLAREL
ncbi:MAG: HU family DNA-binding protein [Alphaproteobacteria bacterium]|nr:HU family DNA-binding protein [Alphaproteobacteria bacterium]